VTFLHLHHLCPELAVVPPQAAGRRARSQRALMSSPVSTIFLDGS
jgi:hypothetical protein